MSFDEAFERVIGHEGGYVSDSRDPGGETRFGISKKQYPNVDIKSLTLDEAKAIYRRDYWNAIRGDMLGDLAFDVFDAAVNQGVTVAIRMLQKSLGVGADGVIGMVTLNAAQAADPATFRMKFNAARLDYYAELPTWPAFGKGWVRRVANNLRADHA